MKSVDYLVALLLLLYSYNSYAKCSQNKWWKNIILKFELINEQLKLIYLIKCK